MLHVHGRQVGRRIEVASVPAPAEVEIQEQEGGVFLLRLNAEGQCIADTWHETVQAAKAQASFEFGVVDGEWQSIP